jgi:hypothetical protein
MIDSRDSVRLEVRVAKQIKDAGRLNSPSAIQPTEDAEMRSATRVIQVRRVTESFI